MKDKKWILYIMIPLIMISIIIATAWILSPQSFVLQINLNDHALEAFKIANNCTGATL